MKKILIIGASGGIGHKVAEILLSKEYLVTGTYFKNPQKLDDLKTNNKFEVKYLDLSDLNSINTLYKDTNEDIFAVINCAGIIDFEGDSLEKDFEIWNRTLAVNLSGNYHLAKTFYDKISEGGRFIMISSTDSFCGGATTSSYAVSKAGVNSLTKSLSLLFAKRKIRVNSVAPGWVLTPMIEDNGVEFLDKVADINPLKRNAKPLDIANLIEFLLSEESNYINGQVIAIEGGYTNQDPTLLIEENL